MNATFLRVVLFIVSILSAAVVSSELICAGANDCYPKVFEATNEWQVIREGQDIPGGLHVRMDINTGEKLAKLMEPGEENGVVLVEDADQPILESGPVEPNKRPRVTEAELGSYGNAVDEIIAYDQDDSTDSRLVIALETLGELSHDIEFGARITSDKTLFAALDALTKKLEARSDYADRIYRIVLSSLRNNPEAVQNFLSIQPASYIQFLFGEIHATTTSNVVKKRILGVIHALTTNKTFKDKYFDGTKSEGHKHLLAAYSSLDQDGKIRVMNLLADLNLVKSFSSPAEVAIPTPIVSKKSVTPSERAKHIESQFLNDKVDSEQLFKFLFNELKYIHENNEDVKPSDEFIEWLDAEAAQRKDGTRKRDHIYSGQDPEFDRQLLEARNVVFGNPNGMRRHMDYDEL